MKKLISILLISLSLSAAPRRRPSNACHPIQIGSYPGCVFIYHCNGEVTVNCGIKRTK